MCVVPLHIARGVQNKVLEALAMGKTVVCTPQALEGLNAVPGKDVVVAENHNQFAEATIRLIKDQSGRNQFGANARICVENGYSWSKNLEILQHTIERKAQN